MRARDRWPTNQWLCLQYPWPCYCLHTVSLYQYVLEACMDLSHLANERIENENSNAMFDELN
jgi:hypothetical protein